MTASMASLGEVAELVRGVTYKPVDVSEPNDPNALPCMRTKNIQADLETNYLVYIPASSIRQSKLLREGDTLISSANSWNLVGKCCWVPSLPFKATFGGFTTVLRADQNLMHPRYLYRWFSTSQIQDLARSFGQKTTNISNLNLGRCLDMQIPLPPLEEQRRIAAILDKADALRRKRKRALDLLDSLTQSIFLEMFGDGSRWNVIQPLGELSDIVSGITKGRKLNVETVRSIGYLAVANVQDKRLDLTKVKTIDATEDEICCYRLRQDDLLLTEGGDPDKLGRGTLWNDEIEEVIHQNNIFRVRVGSDDLLPLYLMWLVGSAYGKSYFLRFAKQTTGIASINKQQLSSFPVPMPPLRLQKSFANALEKVQYFLNDAAKARAMADMLFASLQSRAFSGQL